ncbi:MAG TPA: hypothetical protein DD611_01170 [Alphaproteobacteria bacterium]|nr:hypothetical protein [Alphaproteobacteria bacterium]
MTLIKQKSALIRFFSDRFVTLESRNNDSGGGFLSFAATRISRKRFLYTRARAYVQGGAVGAGESW